MKADLKVRLYVKIRLYGVGPVRQDGWKPPATCKVQVADGRACLAVASAKAGGSVLEDEPSPKLDLSRVPDTWDKPCG